MAKCFRGSPVYRQFVGTRNDLLAARVLSADTTARDVFYTGPCPTADPNDQTNMDNNLCNAICGNICSGICGSCGYEPCTGQDSSAFAFCADSGSLYLDAGSMFRLDGSVYCIGPMHKDAGCITIGQNGRYLAVWTLSGLARANINSRIMLRQNGNNVGVLNAVAMQGDTIALTGRSIIDARAGDVLQLFSTGALAIGGMPAAVLALVRVD